MNTSASSISFVITAIYTYTFANAVFRVLEFNEALAEIQVRAGTTWSFSMCMAVCLTMALRFFFGNNNYVDRLYVQTIAPGKRLYHLTVIVVQSLILLGSSYLIRNPARFFAWVAALFAVEVLWYVLSALFVRDAVTKTDGTVDKPLAVNEAANLAMALGAFTAAGLWSSNPRTAITVAATAFALNTIIDFRVNFRAYMGVDPISKT